MRRLKSWLLTKLAKPRDADAFAGLPFDADEFARLLRSKSPSDMKRLASGLARPASRVRVRTL